jgi:hypothetical protein
MSISQAVLIGILSIGLLGSPLASEAQPALEQFRFNPPQLCFRETFRWAFSYRGLPGGLAAVKDVELFARWEGPGEQSIRSVSSGRSRRRPSLDASSVFACSLGSRRWRRRSNTIWKP